MRVEVRVRGEWLETGKVAEWGRANRGGSQLLGLDWAVITLRAQANLHAVVGPNATLRARSHKLEFIRIGLKRNCEPSVEELVDAKEL